MVSERSDVGGTFEPPKRSDYLLGFEVQGDSLVHNSNYPRPATAEEKILWAEYKRVREEYTKACTDLWSMYQAGTGQNIHTFEGVNTENPIEDVRTERNRLIKELLEAKNVTKE